MALVKVEIYKGKSGQYKRAVLDSIRSALVTAFQMPVTDISQRLYELADENFEKSEVKSKNFTIIEIAAFKGRSREAKRSLYAGIVNNLSNNPGIDEKDILIVLNEQPLENWGIHGGKPADEVALGFDVNV